MEKLKVWAAVLIAGFLALWPVGMAVLADSYVQTITITIFNNSATPYNYLGVLASINNSQLATQGYILASGLDTNVTEAGTSKPYGVASPNLGVGVNSLLASQTRQYIYKLGYAPAQSTYKVVPGWNGNISTTDAPSIEPAGNFSVETSSYIDTTLVGGNISYKSGAVQVVVSAAGTVQSSVTTPATNTSQLLSSGAVESLGTGGPTRDGERLNSWPASTITQVQFLMRKVNAPTGIASVTVRKVSDDSLLGTVGTQDVSLLTASFVWYTYSTPVAVPAVQDIRVQVEYAGDGNPANVVQLNTKGTDEYPGGVWTSYNAGYTDTAGRDATFSVSTPITTSSVSQAAVASGEHNVYTYLIGGTLGQSVDGGAAVTTAVTGNVSDTANNWIWGSNAVPYFTYVKGNISQAQKWWYEPNTIYSSTNLADRSGNGNTGTVNFGANPAGVTVTVGALTPFITYTSGATSNAAVPDIWGNLSFMNTSASPSDSSYGWFFLDELFGRTSDSLDWSHSTLYGFATLVVGISMFFATAVALHSIMWGGVMLFAVTGMAAAGGFITGWVPLGVLVLVLLGFWAHSRL